ncbi:MAG TPA: YqaJ viral recombinase family protein [Casimicrobiaceae bacterium]|jgi:putative phage-type endonuclease
MNIVKLMQGSPEWHEHRRKHRNASETPVVLGVSPWQTPYQLWQYKLGLVEPEVTSAMHRGTELEPTARAAYEALTGLVMQPLVLVGGEYSVSLDGLTLCGDRILEIKCPMRGRDSTLWKTVEAGRLPEHYQWQVQHQLMVTKAEVAAVFVFDGAEGIQLEVAPDPHAWPQIHAAWDAFMRCISEAQAPPLTARDTRVRDDPEWLSAAAAYLELRTAYDALGINLDEAKAQLVALARHAKEQGGGVSVSRLWKRGTVEFKRVPELADVDLEQYRGAGREEVRISIA